MEALPRSQFQFRTRIQLAGGVEQSPLRAARIAGIALDCLAPTARHETEIRHLKHVRPLTQPTKGCRPQVGVRSLYGAQPIRTPRPYMFAGHCTAVRLTTIRNQNQSS